ncbi:MAG: phenylacetate-CoA oxygenase subunit PaaJ [Anaerolineales bacterium]|nr:phenylacetate-CoA oxygenase subunit PaaJ [Anaerolineales bacterium]
MQTLTQEALWQALATIPDPEIPVVSLVEMGIVREVTQTPTGEVTVTITPTFSGCPALEVMKTDILTRLKQCGVPDVTVRTVLSPPWTTDWITEAAREKLKSFGLAPPPHHGGDFAILLFDPVPCPYCDSQNTTLKNNWGPTPCRMIFYCNQCQQPFEQFKPL